MRTPPWRDGEHHEGTSDGRQWRTLRGLIAGGAALLLTLAGAGVAAAAPVTASAKMTCHVVDTTQDQSYTSLQDAVNAASAGDVLFVKGTCTGTTTIGTSLTLDGQSASGTKSATLDGGQQGSVLTIGRGVTVTLNTLIITDGTGSGDGGGGIYNYGSLTLHDCTVVGNTAFSYGGGIFNHFGTVTLTGNTSITDNHANSTGGGIESYGGTVTMTDDSTITNNTAGFGGGGIDYTDTTLNGVVAGNGGNVYGNTPDDVQGI